jgi:hypothetical protein
MLVQDLFTRLSYGELSNLAIGMEGAGSIDVNREAQALAAVTTALTALYTRFQLRIAFLTLEAMSEVDSYVLSSEHAESNLLAHPTIPHYIKDVTAMPRPFADDVIRILGVRRLDVAATIGLDESLDFLVNSRENATNAVKTLAYNEIRLLTALPGEQFEIEYQANHPPLTLSGSIQIMPALEEALQARTAAAIFAGMSGEAHVARSKELLARYEQLCAEAKLNDMSQESSSNAFDKLRDKGFV